MEFCLRKIDWTAISAIISFLMIIATLFVLYMQLQQNHHENNENRLIQIRTIQHQVEMQHLDRFRDVANECVQLFSLNRYIQAAVLLQTDINAARQIIDNGYDESLLTMSHYNLASKKNNEEMDDSLYSGMSEIGALLDDLQLICIAILATKCEEFSLFKKYVLNDKDASIHLKNIILNYTPKNTCINDISLIAYKRVKMMQDSEIGNNTVSVILDYINAEQTRIDKILLRE